jgi:hypothetical protein
MARQGGERDERRLCVSRASDRRQTRQLPTKPSGDTCGLWTGTRGLGICAGVTVRSAWYTA